MSDQENLKKVLERLTLADKYDEVLKKSNKFGPTTKFEGDRLIWLDLSNFGITKLPSGLFDDLTNLQELKLFKNNISDLPLGIFDKLVHLSELHLKDNDLVEFKKAHIENLPNLNRLFLLGNDKLGSLAKVYPNRQMVEQLIGQLSS